ncbi:MAG: hypothetical protein J3K34DRAFT_518762 [Monoraphidium minutum]|nr:MAG: hypothetical protein J3K34DRAFT_518762 [Monoraphidium minutum]
MEGVTVLAESFFKADLRPPAAKLSRAAPSASPRFKSAAAAKALLDRLKTLAHEGRPASAARRAAAAGGGGGGGGEAAAGAGAGAVLGPRLAAKRILDELDAAYSSVSCFLRRLPPEAVLGLFTVIYEPGAAAAAFYVVLAGSVEAFTRQQRGGGGGGSRPGAAVARAAKGDCFGEQGLLEGSPRWAGAVPATASVTLLAVDREDFLAFLGPFFRAQRDAARAFLATKARPPRARASAARPAPTRVRALREAGGPHYEVARLGGLLLAGGAKAGRAWELAAEPQVFFVKEGVCQLELVDSTGSLGLAALGAAAALNRRQPPAQGGARGGAARPSTAPAGAAAPRGDGGEAEGDPDGAAGGGWGRGGGARPRVMPALAAEGVLASVRMAGGGRVVGTLGMEDEAQRAQLRGVAKRAVARLGPGSWFGGGATLMGEGPVQGALRVVAAGEVELYHVHVDVFLQHAGDDLIRAVRDDCAFHLTYSLGRMGLIPRDAIVGHPAANMRRAGQAHPGAPAPALALLQQQEGEEGGPAAAAPQPQQGQGQGAPSGGGGGGGAAAWRPSAAGAAPAGAAGPLPHEGALPWDAVRRAPPARPGTAPGAVRCAATAAEAFWRRPDSSATATGGAVASLLCCAFPEGLAPLAEGAERLTLSTEPWALAPPAPAAPPPPPEPDADAGAGAGGAAPTRRPASAGCGAAGGRGALALGLAETRPRPVSAAAAAGAAPRAGSPSVAAAAAAIAGARGAAGARGRPAPARAARVGLKELRAGKGFRNSVAGGVVAYFGWPHAAAILEPAAAAGAAAAAAAAAAMGAPAGGRGARQRQEGGPPSPARRPGGSLTAACVLWAGASDGAFRPPLRQCLTYDEIVGARGAC